MRGIPYLMDFSDLVNEAHVRPPHDASSLGDSMVFRIYTFVMRMSHNLTKSDKIF